MIKQLKCTPLRDEFCKEVNIESIIYQRQGPGWILLQSKEKNDLEEAEKLYLKVYEEEDHPFNHYYCNLQLARAYFKLSQVSDEKKKIDHYYKSAIERLNEGGVHEHTPFDSALSIAENKGKTWVDAKPAIYLLQGEILADKNGDRDFQKAEASFQKVIDLGALSPDKPLDDYVFLAHYQLAMLYICQANLCHILPREKKEYIFKAKKSAWDALRKLAKQPGILDKRQNEIDELEELLDKHVDN